MKRPIPALSALATTLLVAVAGFGAATPAMADMALATAKNCMACHAVDKKLVGPSYKDVAAKYAGQKDAVDKLSAKVIKGGSGVWGPIPMPANAQVTPDEAKKLVTWIMTQQ
jgi:cytochrome c